MKGQTLQQWTDGQTNVEAQIITEVFPRILMYMKNIIPSANEIKCYFSFAITGNRKFLLDYC